MSAAPNRSLPILPSSDIPWDVKVGAVVPKKVHNELEKSSARNKQQDCATAIGSVADRWCALLLEGKLYVWTVVTESFDPPQNVHVLYHAKMAPPAVMYISITPTNANANSTAASATSLSSASASTSAAGSAASSSTSSDVVFVHAASQDGHLYLWKIGRKDRASSIPRSPQARVSLKLDADNGEVVTALTSWGSVLIVGTSLSSLWWCTPTSHPIMLHAQKVERQQGFLSRMIYGSTGISTSKKQGAASIQSIEILSPKVFLSVSQDGHVELWKVTTTIASSHQATFEGTSVTTLKSAMASHLRTSTTTDAGIRLEHVKVLRTTLYQRNLHFLVLVNDQRVYWVRGIVTQTSSFELDHAVWLNRFHPEVKCVGLVSTHQNVAYAAFQYANTAEQQQQEQGSAAGGAPVTMMAFLPSGKVSEVDMPLGEVPSWIDGTLGRDIVTYGAFGFATTGIGIRTRFVAAAAATDAQPQQHEASSLDDGSTHQSMQFINTLEMHLRAAFWQWYQQEGGTGVRLPPSIQSADSRDLEAAIVLTANFLRSHESTSKHNPMEWHNAFLKMLQQGGLYRSISQRGRWALLGIGQELAVYQVLHGKMEVRADAVANALAEVNNYQVLSLALETANQYRDECASPVYDVVNIHTPSHRIWTSNDTLQAVMWRQLEAWSEATKLPSEQVTTVVTTALTSFKEAASDPNAYEQVKELAIPLIRKIQNDQTHNDHLAFELAKEHSWNAGLCQIARDHKKEIEFNLDGLMQARDDAFCEYVLQWHADKGLAAQVLNYGLNCPDLLDAFLEKDDRLRKHRYLAAARERNWELATKLLLKMDDGPLSKTRRHLSTAKMLPFDKYNELIDRKLELVRAQELLQGDSDDPLLSPEQLLSLALDKLELETQVSLEDKVKTAVIALSIAGASNERIPFAARVWSAVIAADRKRWNGWLQFQHDPQLRKLILESTVFGGLWTVVQEQHEDEVRYGSALDSLVMEHLGMGNALSASMDMKRLLHYVTMPVSAADEN